MALRPREPYMHPMQGSNGVGVPHSTLIYHSLLELEHNVVVP